LDIHMSVMIKPWKDGTDITHRSDEPLLRPSWYKLKVGEGINLNLLYKQQCLFLSDLGHFFSPADNSISLLLTSIRYLSIPHQGSRIWNL
jgi:hypothetical protein